MEAMREAAVYCHSLTGFIIYQLKMEGPGSRGFLLCLLCTHNRPVVPGSGSNLSLRRRGIKVQIISVQSAYLDVLYSFPAGLGWIGCHFVSHQNTASSPDEKGSARPSPFPPNNPPLPP